MSPAGCLEIICYAHRADLDLIYRHRAIPDQNENSLGCIGFTPSLLHIGNVKGKSKLRKMPQVLYYQSSKRSSETAKVKSWNYRGDWNFRNPNRLFQFSKVPAFYFGERNRKGLIGPRQNSNLCKYPYGISLSFLKLGAGIVSGADNLILETHVRFPDNVYMMPTWNCWIFELNQSSTSHYSARLSNLWGNTHLLYFTRHGYHMF